MKSNRLDKIILGNKLNRPAVDLRWVHRPRLIERLEKNLAKRVTLIIAAAGYGKTTLAAQGLRIVREMSHGCLSIHSTEIRSVFSIMSSLLSVLQFRSSESR